MARKRKDRDRKRRRRQQPKTSWRNPRAPLGGLPPLAPHKETTTTTTTYMDTPPVGTYPLAPDQHAVTTNQEPPATWPDVDLPPLSGFTVNELPADNGQDNPQTTFDPATVEQSPYQDYNTQVPDSGPGNMYADTSGYPDTGYPDTGTDTYA